MAVGLAGAEPSGTNVTIVLGGPGGAAEGGGIFVNTSGTLTATNTTISSNQANGGAGGDAPAGNEDGGIALGGGIYSEGTLTLTDVTISGNRASGGIGKSQSPGGSASGGGIDDAGTLAMSETSLTGNASSGGTGFGPGPNGTGGEADGGGLAVESGAPLNLTALTFAGNTSTGGNGAASSEPASGGAANGGAIDVANGGARVTLTNLTLSGNSVVGGIGGQDTSSGPGGNGGSATGGGLATLGKTTLLNPAIDQGGTSANGCPATDQRGVFRPQGRACDVGADEFVFPPTISSVQPSQGALAGGYAVTITGTNFVPGATVTLGGQAAINVVVSSATTITARVPAGTGLGAVDVTVNDPTGASGFGDASNEPGTLTGGFTYAAPTPTAIPPTATPRTERLFLPFVPNGAAVASG